jgi:hypothetical protein
VNRRNNAEKEKNGNGEQTEMNLTLSVGQMSFLANLGAHGCLCDAANVFGRISAAEAITSEASFVGQVGLLHGQQLSAGRSGCGGRLSGKNGLRAGGGLDHLAVLIHVNSLGRSGSLLGVDHFTVLIHINSLGRSGCGGTL